jgi:hypothetical protein
MRQKRLSADNWHKTFPGDTAGGKADGNGCTRQNGDLDGIGRLDGVAAAMAKMTGLVALGLVTKSTLDQDTHAPSHPRSFPSATCLSPAESGETNFL